MQIIAICKGCDNEIPIEDAYRDCGAVIRIEVGRCRTKDCDPDFCENCEDMEAYERDIDTLKAAIRELEKQIKQAEV